MRKRRLGLSITHKFTSEIIAEGEVGETGEAAPHDNVAWHGITCAGQVAAPGATLTGYRSLSYKDGEAQQPRAGVGNPGVR